MKSTSIRRTVSSLAKAIAVVGISSVALPSMADCIQDQYGNQYNLTFDTTHFSITGTAKMAQCGGDEWPIVGSYSGSDFNKRQQAITFANATANASCTFGPFMLKGKYPKFAWYYNTGYGGQESKFVACTVEAVPTSAPGQGAQR